MGVALSWLGLILCMGLFFLLVEASWMGFLWTFKIVDDHLQERHWINLHKRNTEELMKMFSETEEMAA